MEDNKCFFYNRLDDIIKWPKILHPTSRLPGFELPYLEVRYGQPFSKKKKKLNNGYLNNDC